MVCVGGGGVRNGPDGTRGGQASRRRRAVASAVS